MVVDNSFVEEYTSLFNRSVSCVTPIPLYIHLYYHIPLTMIPADTFHKQAAAAYIPLDTVVHTVHMDPYTAVVAVEEVSRAHSAIDYTRAFAAVVNTSPLTTVQILDLATVSVHMFLLLAL